METPISKRELLQNSAAALTGLTVVGNVSAESSIHGDQNWDQFEAKIIQEYGEQEGGQNNCYHKG